jgi:hypothetical protein
MTEVGPDMTASDIVARYRELYGQDCEIAAELEAMIRARAAKPEDGDGR